MIPFSTVSPISGRPDFLFGAYEADTVGYTMQEYFVSGEATSYVLPQRHLPTDGRWDAVAFENASFTTRVVVLAPEDIERFNGTVIVEWLNVTGGTDSPAFWLMAHREIMRAGYAYMAVSAQEAGVEGGGGIMGPDNSLKSTNPGRYSDLAHPGDAYAFDIFSQAGRLALLSGPNGLLGRLKAKHVIGVGESQSAAFLSTYINAVDPLAKVYDGFLVHSRFGAVASIHGEMDLAQDETSANAIQFRPDLRVPVMNYITEGDLLGFPGVMGYFAARQPDSEMLRTWEVAGASHADNYTIAVSFLDSGKASIDQLAAAYAPMSSIMGLPVESPINFGPQHHYTVQAALSALSNWVSEGVPPSSAPRIKLEKSEAKLSVDANGIAEGGVRTPWIDVPTARLAGEGNSGSLMTAIFGSSEMFSNEHLRCLYPMGKPQYLRSFETSLDSSIACGHILAADREEILELAELMYSQE
ncbi:alpha/beta hydrolase domain-containing protein [Novosphingobium malaysiense]|uniref:Alpha/beta hydrolase domain-containing protein n=1 Tax=Novosphingobium malaysiense TaxID=1348853 RepID=A0A0B1ZIN0_9SPHN|nr:alpha/beta hydrolase domain-containing protein [Novosphingobium malaysiense]KHK90392.1 hypothetical protein LK12_17540 [Novosphingobium malaysiense]